jgi:hypothetical protein
MGRLIVPRPVSLLPLLALLLATPKPVHAYVDPGSGSMLWQLAAAAAIGSLFYVRRVFTWMRERLGLPSTSTTASPVRPALVTVNDDALDGQPKSAGAD